MLQDINPENKRLLDRYEMICRNKGLSEQTIKAYCKFDIPLFLKFIGDMALKDADDKVCEDFLFYCQLERKNQDQALSRKFTTLNSFYKTMIKRGYLTLNPFDKLDGIKIKKKVREHLTPSEIKQVFDYLEKEKDQRSLAIFALFFYSGVRLSELYQLNRNDLIWETRKFKVLGKGQKERVCIFSDYAKAKLLDYLSNRKDNYECLFLSRQNNRLSRRRLQEIVKSKIKEAGIEKDLSPHNLRHSCAMWLLHSGLPLDKIQIVLGHENISTTQIYAHNNINDVQDLVDNIHL